MARRPDMLASTVRQLIAPILRECPPECGVVSISRVDISSDLSYATLYVSALKKPEVAIGFLEGKTKEMQRKLSALGTHRTPHLRFRLDTQLDEGNRIDELLKRASENSPSDVQ
jgi:ribosome-binding factor A